MVNCFLNSRVKVTSLFFMFVFVADGRILRHEDMLLALLASNF